MSYPATVFKVMIASPSDVAAERDIIRETLSEWNVANADLRKVVLLPVAWETHSAPEMGDRPQAIVNKHVLCGCDLLVAVFWTRIGTATGGYESGTVEEIEEHIKAGKPAMLYFSAAPVIPDKLEPGQYKRLKQFKDSCRSRGILESYADPDEFRSKFYRQLQIKLNQDPYFTINSTGAQSITELQAPPRIPLSREAQVLLKDAANAAGQILHIHLNAGLFIRVGGKSYVEDNNPRSDALWEGALTDLENNNLVAPASSKREMFTVTREGYEMADQITL